MKKIAVLFACAIAAGCESTPEKKISISEIDNDSLCVMSIESPENKSAAEAELGARQASCDWNKVQLILQARQHERDVARQKMAAFGAAMARINEQNARQQQDLYDQQMRALKPQTFKANCTTTYFGNQANTVCQ